MKRSSSYFVSSAFLLYFGLKDLNDFNWLYNGTALAIGVAALVAGLVEFMKGRKANSYFTINTFVSLPMDLYRSVISAFLSEIHPKVQFIRSSIQLSEPSGTP